MSKAAAALEASQAKLEAAQHSLESERQWLTEQQRALKEEQATLAAWRSDQVCLLLCLFDIRQCLLLECLLVQASRQHAVVVADSFTRACPLSLGCWFPSCALLCSDPPHLYTHICPLQAAALEELGSRDAELSAQKASLDARAAELDTWAAQVRRGGLCVYSGGRATTCCCLLCCPRCLLNEQHYTVLHVTCSLFCCIFRPAAVQP